MRYKKILNEEKAGDYTSVLVELWRIQEYFANIHNLYLTTGYPYTIPVIKRSTMVHSQSKRIKYYVAEMNQSSLIGCVP